MTGVVPGVVQTVVQRHRLQQQFRLSGPGVAGSVTIAEPPSHAIKERGDAKEYECEYGEICKMVRPRGGPES